MKDLPKTKCIEEALVKRVKTIDDGEWTLLGTPADSIVEVSNAIVHEIQRIADDVPVNLLLNEIVNRFFVPMNESSQEEQEG